MQDAPKCWGKFAECKQHCEFAVACKIYTETEPEMDKPLYGQDYDSVAEWAPDLADYSHIPGENLDEGYDGEEDSVSKMRSSSDFAGFLNFLLHLDNYTLGILAEIIAPSREEKRYSVADLARIHGISRQGMHRKMLDIARKSPELATLLAMTIKKIRNARQEFTTPCCNRKMKTGQMEFHF